MLLSLLSLFHSSSSRTGRQLHETIATTIGSLHSDGACIGRTGRISTAAPKIILHISLFKLNGLSGRQSSLRGGSFDIFKTRFIILNGASRYLDFPASTDRHLEPLQRVTGRRRLGGQLYYQSPILPVHSTRYPYLSTYTSVHQSGNSRSDLSGHGHRSDPPPLCRALYPESTNFST